MTFKDISNIIKKLRDHPDSIITDPNQREIERARELLQQLRTNHLIAYRQRRDKWYAEHPNEQYFSPPLDETRKDMKLQEWVWHSISRIFNRSPEQRFQDEKRPSYGWNHLSDVHSVEGPCVEGCRFWSEEGRIEDTEVLNDYEKYNRYQEVLEIWTEQ